MGNYYIQVNTLNAAMGAISDNTRAGHHIQTAIGSYYPGVIFYLSSTGNTFFYCKQLTFDGQGVPNGYSTTARFDDFPVEGLSYVETAEIMVDKEFIIAVNNNALCGIPSTFLTASKAHGGASYLNLFSGGWQSRIADQTYPLTSAAISGYIYYTLIPGDEDSSPTVQFTHYIFKYLFTGESGYYIFKASNLNSAVSVSGSYVRTIAGAAGADGADGADGVNGVDGADGIDAPVPDLTNIETALSNLSNLSKYTDMVTAFGNLEKIVNSICALMSNTARVPADLNFTDNKNADNLVTKAISVDFATLNQKLTDIFTDTVGEGEGAETVKMAHLVEAFINIFDKYSNEVSIVSFLKRFVSLKMGV